MYMNFTEFIKAYQTLRSINVGLGGRISDEDGNTFTNVNHTMHSNITNTPKPDTFRNVRESKKERKIENFSQNQKCKARY